MSRIFENVIAILKGETCCLRAEEFKDGAWSKAEALPQALPGRVYVAKIEKPGNEASI